MTEQQMLRSDATDSSSQSTEELWRTEIQARVARYKTRRGRRVEGTYSMRFPFSATDEESPSPIASAAVEVAIETLDHTGIEAAAEEVCVAQAAEEEPELVATSSAALAVEPLVSNEEAVEATLASLEKVESQSTASTIQVDETELGSEFLLEPDPEPLPPQVPRPPVKRKIIAFPRQVTNLEESHRLADPMMPEQPRILDVPEELEPFPTTPLLEGLRLPASPAATHSRDHVDLPAAPVSIPRRILAGLVDCGVVLGGCAVFGAAAYKLMSPLQPSKTLILGAAVIPLMLWAVYEYLLLMYAGTTLGLRVTRTRLSTFRGVAPNWRHRRSRVIGLYFSAASLMMGLLWSLVDVDALCWHDRISHTYLTKID
jgi:uncharacterized RDD family membrane protein YckC